MWGKFYYQLKKTIQTDWLYTRKAVACKDSNFFIFRIYDVFKSQQIIFEFKNVALSLLFISRIFVVIFLWRNC